MVLEREMWMKDSGISVYSRACGSRIFFYLIGNGPLLIDNISLLGAVGGGNIQKTMIRH